MDLAHLTKRASDQPSRLFQEYRKRADDNRHEGRRPGRKGLQHVSIPPKRGKVTGWSKAAACRNAEFLVSIDNDRCDGEAISVSLTFGREELCALVEWADAAMKNRFK
jgi:hypothetical protein